MAVDDRERATLEERREVGDGVAGAGGWSRLFAILAVLQFFFAWVSSNMNSLAMEPLGKVAGTAAAVFGFLQTVGGAVIGTIIGQLYNGTLVTNAAAWTTMGVLVVTCALVAERGRLFGISVEYRNVPAVAE